MKIALACDHSGLEYKEITKQMLIDMGYEIEDFGTHSHDSMDYPDTAGEAAKSVACGNNDRGIVFCSTGVGVSIVVNKVHGIRCALVHDTVTAKLTRQHNDTNVLAIGQLTTGVAVMKEIVKIWLDTEFSQDERHIRRIEKVMRFEDENVA